MKHAFFRNNKSVSAAVYFGFGYFAPGYFGVEPYCTWYMNMNKKIMIPPQNTQALNTVPPQNTQARNT